MTSDVKTSEVGIVLINGIAYEVQRNWGDFSACPPGRPSQVAVDRSDRLHVLRREISLVAVLDGRGEFLFSYGANDIFDGHAITMDGHGRAWIADRDAHQILCFSEDGTLLLRLGDRHSPRWDLPFNHPTKVSVAKTGDMFVADGYGNARIHHFDPSGRLVSSFGDFGRGRRQMMTPHSLIADRRGRILVCDREGDRVQVFDTTGRWQQTWMEVAGPMDILEREDGSILVTDRTPTLVCFDMDGKVLGRCRPSLNGAHGIAIDSRGNIYLAETTPASITRLKPH